MDYSKLSYTVNGVNDINFTEAIKLWKTKFPDFRDFKREIITNDLLADFGNFMEEMWDNIELVKVSDAFAQTNLEKRRVYFNCIGVETLFKELNPTLLDSQTVTKRRAQWGDDNTEQEYVFEDTYELYEIDQAKLEIKNNWGGDADNIYAVKCKCTTTGREYWIYVPINVATGIENWQYAAWKRGNPATKDAFMGTNVGPSIVPDYDAIRAIAWTIRIDYLNPERIYRQGDIIVCKLGKDSVKTSPYHITKDQYLNLMYSET